MSLWIYFIKNQKHYHSICHANAEMDAQKSGRTIGQEETNEVTCDTNSKCDTAVTAVTSVTISTQKKVLNLGVFGKIPIHALSEFYISTHDDEILTLYQARNSLSLGGWVYDGASCLAKYLESQVLAGAPGESYPSGGCLAGQTVVELGAGTGVVGLMAAYHGADVIITDLSTLIPLIQHNIDENRRVLRGSVRAATLSWGDDASHCLRAGRCPDYLILANCVYYDTAFHPLHQSMLDLTTPETKILVCYEERTPEIARLIQRWHEVIDADFEITHIPDQCVNHEYKQDFVRLLSMKRKKM